MHSSLFRRFRFWNSGLFKHTLELFPIAAFPLASAIQPFMGAFYALSEEGPHSARVDPHIKII
jgi:hypothetical protein